MSKKKNNHLQLINSTIIPQIHNCFFSSENDLIYSISSKIIIHNLSNNTKKIINNKYKTKITNLKYLDKEMNLLLVINQNIFPIINILSLDSNYIIKNNDQFLYSKKIPIEENFSISNIFIDRFRYNLFLIILSNKDKNILYFFHIINVKNNRYDIIPFGKLQNSDLEIIDFKSFYNDNLIICITRNSLIYYKINLEQKLFESTNNIKFQYKLLPYSLKINRKNSLIAILSEIGESLIYDKDGNNICNIKCPIQKENFNSQLFSDYNNSMCLSTNKGNIFIYKINSFNETYIFKVKSYIKNSFINKIINEKYLYNKNIYINNNQNKNIIPNNNKNDSIKIIYYNEKDDIIIFTLNNGDSFLKSSLTNLINKNNNKEKNSIYVCNHSQKINNGIVIYNEDSSYDNKYDNIIYSCSNDNKLIKNYYNYSTNKFYNYFFNFDYLFNDSNIFITSIRFHPKNTQNILYAGDNKGCLYIIYKERNYQYQKYYLIKENNVNEIAIISIKFSPEKDYIIYIGFNNGMQRLYDLSVDKNFNYYKLLSNSFLEKNEIDYKTKKNHAICFGYFFIYKYILRKCILYLNNQNMIKISKINNNESFTNNNYNNEILLIKNDSKVLDLKIHKSEEYLIVLNSQKQIIINELHYGNVVSKIDLNQIMNYIYNIELDISGLYLSLICDFKNSNLYSNKTSLAIMELNTGKIKNYIKEINFPITKSKFDYYGRFLITFGEKGEISIWEFDKDIKNDIINSINQIKIDFYNYWDNYKIKNYTDIDMNNYNIINEILNENQNITNLENNYLDLDNYQSPEDFFRINNHGEKSINNISKTISNKNSLNNNSLLSANKNIDENNNNLFTNMSKTISNNKFNGKVFDNIINVNKNNSIENNAFEDFNTEDHFINRKSNNYKNSINYISTFRNNHYNNNIINNKNFETVKEKEFYLNNNNNIKKRRISSTNSKIIINNKKLETSSLKSNKSKSFRDIIINKDKNIDMPRIIKYKNEMNKNETNILNNNIETPHFLLSQKSIKSSKFNYKLNNIKNQLNLFSLSLPKETIKNIYSNRDNNNNIFDLKKKIINQSSILLHNERRMINLSNAFNKMNKKKTFSNKNNNSKEEEKDKNYAFTKSSKNYSRIINCNNKKNKYLNFDKKILFGENKEIFNKKYPEPDDIDLNLVNNIKEESDIFKINNIVQINNNKNKISDSSDNLYFINNNRDNNSNFYSNYNNKSTSFSIIKDFRFNKNNNSSLNKNNSILTNYINYNINEKYDSENTSIGDQISYLENNINKFEKNFQI